MSSKRIVQVIVALLTITETTFAYDITDAIDAALKNNTKLKESEIEFQSAKLNRFSAAANFLPQVVARSSTSKTFVDGIESKAGTPRQDALSIEEEIFSGGKGIYNLKASKFISEAAAMKYQNEVDAAIVQTVQAYEGVISAREMYNVAQQNVENLDKIVKQSEVKISVGAITRTDMLESKARLAKAKADKEKAYSEMRNAEENFKYTTGDVAPKEMHDIDVTSLTLPNDIATFLEEIENNSPNIKVAEKNLLATKFKTKSTKTALLPTISASASISRQKSWQQDPFGFRPPVKQELQGNTYQLSFNIPVFQRGLEYVSIKKAILDEESALNSRNDTILKTNKDAASAWNNYLQAKSSVSANTESVNYYKAFADGLEEEFSIGTKTLTDLLQAQLNYESARTQLIQDKARMVVSALNIKYSLGQINEVDFSKLVFENKADTKKVVKIEKKSQVSSNKLERVASISTEN